MEINEIKPEFLCNLSDYVSTWQCVCGYRFKTTHDRGVLRNTDIIYCCKCGVKFNWKLDEVED